ncbi:MAG TPA: PH domain-containing protein, partial [Anaerolineales bacterium]
EFDEQELWKGRPFLSVSESYLLTNERIRITKGFVGRDIENYELIRIQDIDLSQGLSERLLNIGDIHLRGHDPSRPDLVLRNVSKPEEVYETLRRAWLAARKRHGLQFREEM